MRLPIRVVIVDDEPLALDRLEALLKRLDGVEVVGRASGCATGAALIVAERPDLALLDIAMRDGTGFDLLDALPSDAAPLIAFTTAFPRYACRAFEIEAVDYLLKPVEPQQLEQLLARVRRRMAVMTAEQRIAELRDTVALLSESAPGAAPFPADFWVRKRGTDRLRIQVASIDWIGVQDDYVSIQIGGDEHLLRTSLHRLAQALDPRRFVRIHRGIIVQTDRVERIVANAQGAREAVLFDGTRLPIGRVYARSLPWNL